MTLRALTPAHCGVAYCGGGQRRVMCAGDLRGGCAVGRPRRPGAWP